MKHTKGLPVGAVAVIVIVLLGFAVSIGCFRRANEKAILEQNTEFLRENTEYRAEVLSDALTSRLQFMENLAAILERSFACGPPVIIDFLEAIKENAFFDDLYFVTSEGIRYRPEEQQWDFQDADFYQRGMLGESGITGVNDTGLEPDKQYVSYYAPVLSDGEVCGVVVGCNGYGSLEEFCGTESGEEYIYGYLVDGSGRVLLSNKGQAIENIFPFLKEKMGADAYEQFVASMECNDIGYGSYRGDYGEGLVCFSALGSNDWYVVQLLTSEKTAEMVAPLKRSACFLETTMALCLILAVGYTLYLTYGRYNQKNRLMEMSLEAMEETFPRIVSVNFRTGECIFVKDRERMISVPFQKYEWEAFRKNFLETIHREDKEKCKSFTSRENMRRVKEQGLVSDTCIYRRKYEGEYQWTQTTIIPVSSSDDCVLMYARKVDESVKAEEFYKARLWETMQKAKEAETVKTEFLKYVSCDVRTAMNVIMGMTALAGEAVRAGKAEEAKHYLDCVDSVGNYTLTMLQDIMQISVVQNRRMRCSKEPFSMRKLLAGFRELHIGIDCEDRNIGFTVECDERLRDRYIGDESRIMQVLGALLSNAFRFNDEGGSVTLRVRMEERGEEADRVSFAVIDTGRGIGEEFKPFLFDIFTKERQYPGDAKAGTGLGLFLAKLALDSMGGQIAVESTPGKGSCFTVYLDLACVPAAGETETMPFRVLVAEDNALNLEIAVEILKSEGFDALGCSSGEQALGTFLDSEPCRFQILLTDIKMPGMDGYELAKRVRESGRSDSGSIRIIAMSAYSDMQASEKAAECGIEEILEKPFRVARFKELMQKRRGCETI